MRRFEGLRFRKRKGAPTYIKGETAMKRIVIALAVAAIVNATQALAEDSPIVLPSKSTYADEHAAEIAGGNFASAFPGEAPEMIVVAPQWTHADRAAGQPVAGSAYAGELPDPIVVETMSTYADNFTGERSVQASGLSDPALAE